MQRRAFITLLASAATTWPLAARAGEAGRLPVVAIVSIITPLAQLAGPDPESEAWRAFVHRLRDLGWIEGKTVVIERRSGEGDPQRAPAIFAEVAAQGVDAIAFYGSPSTLKAAQQATRIIPLVASFGNDPVVGGYVASLAHPGGNLTGVAETIDHGVGLKIMQLLRQLAPTVTKIAYFGPREDWEFYFKDADPAQSPAFYTHVDREELFDAAFAAILREKADALFVIGVPVTVVHRRRIIAFAAEHKLPAAFENQLNVADGGLMSYGPTTEGFRAMADIVDKIFKGAKPVDIPIAQPVKFEFHLNLKTAKTLGLTVPPDLLARADEVIE